MARVVEVAGVEPPAAGGARGADAGGAAAAAAALDDEEDDDDDNDEDDDDVEEDEAELAAMAAQRAAEAALAKQVQEVRLQSGARGAALSTPLVVRSRAARREGGRGGAQASAGGAAPLLHRRASSAGLGLPARCVVERAADLCHVGLLPGPQGGLLMPKSVLRLRSPIRGLCTVVAGNAPCPTEAAELDLQDSNGGRVGVREGAHTSRSHLC